jgi:hypothetical protein
LLSARGRNNAPTAVLAVGQHRRRTKVEQLTARITVGIKTGFMLRVHRVGKGQRHLVQGVTRFIQIFRTEGQ